MYWQPPILRLLPLPLKVLLSGTLILLGLGFLTAEINLYLTYHLTDGKPGMTAADLKRAFHGNRENTKLAAKINGGSMEQFLPKAGDKEKILSWIQDGAEKDAFEAGVMPILQENCTRCHNPNGLQRFTPLTSFEEVMTVTQIDRGEPVSLWARVAHTHLQAIAIMFLVLGGVFWMTSLPEGLKSVLIGTPFVMLAVDFGSRFLARYHPDTVYLMMASGGLMGMLVGVMILLPLYEMWLKPLKK